MQFEFLMPGVDVLGPVVPGTGPDNYYHRIYLASIWGLWTSSNENRFSLIDEFLRHEQVRDRGFKATSLMEVVDEDDGSIALI